MSGESGGISEGSMSINCICTWSDPATWPWSGGSKPRSRITPHRECRVHFPMAASDIAAAQDLLLATDEEFTARLNQIQADRKFQEKP